MKIHHVTDEWDYTLGVEEIVEKRGKRHYYLTLSILRQPARVTDCTLDGIRVRSWAKADMSRRSEWGEVNVVWLRGHTSKHGVADHARIPFITHRAANEQLIRVYNVLRRYERDLLR